MSDSRKKNLQALSTKSLQRTGASKCIICHEDLGESPQLVFDEVGIDLELEKLLRQCFNVKVVQNKNETQALCETCLNDLIETVDIQQKEIEDEATNTREGTSSEGIDPDGNESEYEAANLSLLDTGDEDEVEYNYEMLEEDDVPAIQDVNEGTQDDEGMQDAKTDLEGEDDELYEDVDYLETDANFDFRAFKEACVNSRYDDIIFPADMCCQTCSESFTRHPEIIEHMQKFHCYDDKLYQCSICDESLATFENLDDLAYHLVYKHYDLNKISLYVQCSVCTKRFSNFPAFNKHSCNDTKALSRTSTQCEQCGDIFQSNKRYRFHLQFHLDDHRPKGCMICDRLFSEDSELYEHINYAHEEDTGLTCCRCDMIFTTVDNLKAHRKVHKLDRPYKCQLCLRTYLYNQQLKDHVIAHHSKTNLFQCPICGKSLNKQSLLTKHIMLHEKPEEKHVTCCSLCGFVGENEEETEEHIKTLHEEKIPETEILVVSIDVAYSCEFCEMAFKSVDTLREHRDTHSKDKFFCDMCPLVYDEYKKLKTHKVTHVDYVDKRKTFPVMRHYVCDFPECAASYMQWTSLRSHKRNKHTNASIHVCTECDVEFKNPINYNQHLQSVHGGAVHNCPFCDKSYTSKMAMSVHVARKHNTPKIQCDQCSMVFASAQFLEKHIKTAHCPAQCPQCDKIFKNGKNLTVHERAVHNKEKRYFCSYCKKGYYNQCDVLEHEEAVHKKLRRFACTLCDYKAIYKQTLTIHMRAHNNELPYKCQICPKAFRRSYGLSLHMKRHYDIREFVCPYEGCQSAYPNQGILNSHLKKKHVNGENSTSRKRRTIGIADSLKSNEDGLDSSAPIPKKSRRRYDVPITNVFIDDDDGLDDGVIGEPQNITIKTENLQHTQAEQMNLDSNPDDPVTYILESNGSIQQAVIVQYNEMDHDYIVKTSDKEIYSNVIEEYEVE